MSDDLLERADQRVSTPTHKGGREMPTDERRQQIRAESRARYDRLVARLTQLRDEYVTARTFARCYRRRRPTVLRALGCVMHPQTVTDAWYAADCPRVLDRSDAGLTRRDHLTWKLACFLRGADRA